MKVRFLYHKPIGEHGMGKAIVGLTWVYALFYSWKALKFNYSHEEIWLPDEDECFERVSMPMECDKILSREYLGKCFSSTTRGDAEGVRFAPASEVLKHPERWDYVECIVSDNAYEGFKAEADKLVGKKYDFLGIFGFLNPFPVHSKMKWYCSEICNWAKKLLRITRKKSKRISPRKSAYKMVKAGHKLKSLKGE